MCYKEWKMKEEEKIKNKYEQLSSCLTERQKRLWCAAEALSLKKFGISIVSRATKISKPTIYAGIKEIKNKTTLPLNKIRKKGGGAKKLTNKQPNLLKDLEKLIDPVTKGNPENLLKWSSKGTEKLAKELKNKGYKVSPNSVRTMLKDLN